MRVPRSSNPCHPQCVSVLLLLLPLLAGSVGHEVVVNAEPALLGREEPHVRHALLHLQLRGPVTHRQEAAGHSLKVTRRGIRGEICILHLRRTLELGPVVELDVGVLEEPHTGVVVAGVYVLERGAQGLTVPGVYVRGRQRSSFSPQIFFWQTGVL